ncbi:MAG: hypothetical protein IJ364_07185, partial [Oscillospiraceae bacterium]|nr:hypothetical protein [Oscillospiraceae bacterium]
MEFDKILQSYKAGKGRTEQRILQSENWWKLRNEPEEGDGFKSVSGWLHNVIVSKHADAMAAYPEPNILPREAEDRPEAAVLSAIIPCILEQNHFESTYSDVMWQKLKSGTGVYKIGWDPSRLSGLGDIAIERVNLLNIYWEPGITDIQKSRYVFHTRLFDKDLLMEKYPQLQGKLSSGGFQSSKFLYDDRVDTENKATVIDVYYKKKGALHYCRYVQKHLLFASENEESMAARGLYDHGLYPFVFDALYPIEGSPCGYGFVDICRNPQTEIDILKTSFVKNAAVGATPRYFSRVDGAVNEQEFLDLKKPIVHVNGNLGADSLRPIDCKALDGIYVSLLDRTIQELRETSGNTETSTGNIQSGVTAASAIAALQEAAGKGSKDSTQSSYRAYCQLMELCIELIRQFYDVPRQFRILGRYGSEQFISYSNRMLKPQRQPGVFGLDMGLRLPVFDIKISPQRKNAYTKLSQNELALQLYRLGFFEPDRVDGALSCLEMMDFEGRDQLMQRIAMNGTVYQKLSQYMQLSLALAHSARPEMVEGLSQDILRTVGAAPRAMGKVDRVLTEDNVTG